MNRFLPLLIAAALLPSAALPLSAQDKPGNGTAVKAGQQRYRDIDLETFEKLRKEPGTVVLDVRTEKEFNAGHVPGAVLIDVNADGFAGKVAALDKSKKYLVHCAAGVRSVKACNVMSGLGFQDLLNFKGGYRAWDKAGNVGEK